MRVASRIVDSRWAITNDVRSFSSSRRARWMTTSVRVSTFAVASSRMRRRGRASTARAEPSSGRWGVGARARGGPGAGEAQQLPLADGEVLAALVQLGVVALRQPSDEVVGANGLRRFRDL